MFTFPIVLITISAHGWVGWNNKNRPLTITFEFSQRQEFKSVTLTTYCQLDLGIQPFSQMLAYFSTDGLTYHPQYVKVVNKQLSLSRQTQNITLSLAQRVGRFVKLELYFDNKWLLISEVSFSSQSTDKTIEDNLNNVVNQKSNPQEEDNLEQLSNSFVTQERNINQDLLSDTPRTQPENSSSKTEEEETNSKANLKNKETNQVIVEQYNTISYFQILSMEK